MNRLFVSVVIAVSLFSFGCVSQNGSLITSSTVTPVPDDIVLDITVLQFEDGSEAYGIIGSYSPYDEKSTLNEAREDYLNHCLVPWSREISRHLNEEFVIFFSHGLVINDTWMSSISHNQFYNVQEIANELIERYPDMPIVLIICNPEKDTIQAVNVYYCLGNCWITPDSAYPEHIVFARNVEFNWQVVGKFEDFIQSE